MTKRAVVLNNRFMGQGDEVLGAKLMGNMLRKLWSAESKPQQIVFYNSAVHLLADGSDCLDALTGLEEAGVDLIACGTCIDFFELKSSLKAGRVSDMTEIVKVLLDADSVITL